MTETKTEFRKVANLKDIPLDNLRNTPITIGYISPGKCRKYYTANLLEHDKSYLYMSSGDNNHIACLSELHLIHRFKKSEVVDVIALEAIIHYDIFREV